MSLSMPPRHTGTVVIYMYQFLLISTLDGGAWPTSSPPLYPRKKSRYPLQRAYSNKNRRRKKSNICDMIYLLTAIGLSPGGRSTVHIYTQTIHRATQQFWKSAGRAPSSLVIPWHLPYNRGKSTEKPQSG